MDTPWFLLYHGTSVDGSGPAQYTGRTCDEALARAFLAVERANRYATGYVDIYTDTSHERVRHPDFVLPTASFSR